MKQLIRKFNNSAAAVFTTLVTVCVLTATTLTILIILPSCSPDPDTPLYRSSPVQTQSSTRFRIERVGIIEDSLAYGSRRGIYIIHDTLTGKEYVGVSGVGISETGVHSAGKTTVSDER